MEDLRHIIGLNLTREPNGKPPLTIDGIPFGGVGDIKVDASPSGGMSVTVTFNAKEITGVPNEAPISFWPEALNKIVKES